jgi:hypothetical protein
MNATMQQSNARTTKVQGTARMASLRPQPVRAPRRALAPRAAAVEAPTKVSQEVVDKCVNAIRFLAIDAVNKAKSGHPGLPMGAAPMSYVLFNETMKYNPKNPAWANRDRFVLSAGHGSMLQYALMHLVGYDSVQVLICSCAALLVIFVFSIAATPRRWMTSSSSASGNQRPQVTPRTF